MVEEDLIDFGTPTQAASISVIGVGGGGSNAVNRMYNDGIQYVNYIVCNSDRQDLAKSPVPTKIRLGEGLGCGSDSVLGEQYAKEKSAEIQERLEGSQMVFIAVGMGGGTGTGAAPIIAQIAKEMGILTVAIVTLPYKFEGPARMNSAIDGVENLKKHVDSILVINNETLRELYGTMKLRETWAKADATLATAAKAISDIMQKTGFVNVDFRDVQAVLKDSGISVMAAGSASGENRAYDAVEMTLDSPLLNKADIRGAKKILLNITSTEDNELTSDELGMIMEYIRQKAETDVNITWGYMEGAPDSGDEIGITMIATGFETADIPDLRKKEDPVVHVLRRSGQGTPQTQDVVVEQNTDRERIAVNDEASDILINKTPFDYEKVRRQDDISELENQPAYMRQQSGNVTTQAVGPTRAQEISMEVANRIQGSAPSHISLDKDSKGIVFGDNKYLNHNVD